MSRGARGCQGNSRGGGGADESLRSIRGGGISKIALRGAPGGRGATSARGGAPARGGRGGIGGGRGGGQQPGSSVQLILTSIPPDYPPIVGKLKPLSNAFSHLTPWYKRTSQYLRSNYSVKLDKGSPSPFLVEKYTDNYDEPLKVDKEMQYKVDAKLLPPELTSSGVKRVHKKLPTEAELKKKLERMSTKEEADGNLSEDDQNTDENDLPKKKNKDDTVDETAGSSRLAGEDDEEEQVDEDEELDEGTDYFVSYFDNGEGYGDSDDGDGDPNVY